jgi:cytochrome c-type biogenesis protein CcmH/NrfG
MSANIFLWATAGCFLLALVFVIPPIWILAKDQQASLRQQSYLSLGIIVVLLTSAYCLYYNLGAGQQLAAFYSGKYREQRFNNKQVRPLYARLKRELIKNKLNANIDLANLDLILYFANVDSNLSGGVLQSETKQLLDRVILVAPQQITALNLLAVHAFKTAAYAQAADYWQRIVQQFSPEMRGGHAEQVLNAKIAEAKLFESNLTN